MGVGAVTHPWTGLDLYAYAGEEQVNATAWTIGTQGGCGNPNFVNNGCLDEKQAGGSVGFNTPIARFTCTATFSWACYWDGNRQSGSEPEQSDLHDLGEVLHLAFDRRTGPAARLDVASLFSNPRALAVVWSYTLRMLMVRGLPASCTRFQ